MPTPFIAGNWKMNLSAKESIALLTGLEEKWNALAKQILVAVCPTFVHLNTVCEFLKQKNSLIRVGAQNMHWEKSGAYTGETSGAMLFEIGCRYVILGHSERRHGLGEDDAMIAKKIVASFQHGLLPILCVGETLRERESNQTNTIVKNQVQKALSPLSSSQIESVTIAYEPVWAIGTGKAATPAMAQEVHQMIRQTLEQEYGKSIAHNVRIQYGGSVTAENIHELISQPDIDGALVGGASLKLDSFFKIVQVSAQVKG